MFTHFGHKLYSRCTFISPPTGLGLTLFSIFRFALTIIYTDVEGPPFRIRVYCQCKPKNRLRLGTRLYSVGHHWVKLPTLDQFPHHWTHLKNAKQPHQSSIAPEMNHLFVKDVQPCILFWEDQGPSELPDTLSRACIFPTLSTPFYPRSQPLASFFDCLQYAIKDWRWERDSFVGC